MEESALRAKTFGSKFLRCTVAWFNQEEDTLCYLARLQSAFDEQLRKLQYGKVRREVGFS